MRILGIDPGTKCGWATLLDGHRLASGTWNLAVQRHESDGMRFVRFERQFSEALDGAQLVAYEEVAGHRGTIAAHVYGGLVAMLQTLCLKRGVQYVGIPVATVKQRATGKGNAGKPAMVAAAARQWPGLEPGEDEADALWVATVAWEQYGNAPYLDEKGANFDSGACPLPKPPAEARIDSRGILEENSSSGGC